jgi:hypothetical protein
MKKWMKKLSLDVIVDREFFHLLDKTMKLNVFASIDWGLCMMVINWFNCLLICDVTANLMRPRDFYWDSLKGSLLSTQPINIKGF